MNNSIERENLLSILNVALESVQGRVVVRRFLGTYSSKCESVAVLAIGKAAFSMLEGATDILQERIVTGMLITRDGHLGDANKLSNIECLFAGHPVPDERSLYAGDRLVDWLKALPNGLALLVLISGGTSALVEKLPDGLGLADIQKLNYWLLSSGLAIDAMNAIRRSISMIKGGRLLAFVGERPVKQLLISDVPDDAPAIIGSGLFIRDGMQTTAPENLPPWLLAMQKKARQSLKHSVQTGQAITTTIITSNRTACETARQEAISYGYLSQIVSTALYGDVEVCATEIMAYLDTAKKGCYIWGGETTVQLPENPGRGGRNQQLALLLAQKIQHKANITILCVGTDGTDGASEDAGAVVDSRTIERGRHEGLDVSTILERADAGTFLAASARSEERRVGKECRSRWSPYH